MPTGEVTAGQNCIGELILPVRVVKDRACCVVSREHNLFLSLSGRHGLHKACDGCFLSKPQLSSPPHCLKCPLRVDMRGAQIVSERDRGLRLERGFSG